MWYTTWKRRHTSYIFYYFESLYYYRGTLGKGSRYDSNSWLLKRSYKTLTARTTICYCIHRTWINIEGLKNRDALISECEHHDLPQGVSISPSVITNIGAVILNQLHLQKKKILIFQQNDKFSHNLMNFLSKTCLDFASKLTIFDDATSP